MTDTDTDDVATERWADGLVHRCLFSVAVYPVCECLGDDSINDKLVVQCNTDEALLKINYLCQGGQAYLFFLAFVFLFVCRQFYEENCWLDLRENFTRDAELKFCSFYSENSHESAT